MYVEVDEPYQEEVVEYMKDGVLLLVERENESMVITHASLDSRDTYYLIVNLLGQLSRITGVSYNDTCEDMKEIEDEDMS